MHNHICTKLDKTRMTINKEKLTQIVKAFQFPHNKSEQNITKLLTYWMIVLNIFTYISSLNN